MLLCCVAHQTRHGLAVKHEATLRGPLAVDGRTGRSVPGNDATPRALTLATDVREGPEALLRLVGVAAFSKVVS